MYCSQLRSGIVPVQRGFPGRRREQMACAVCTIKEFFFWTTNKTINACVVTSKTTNDLFNWINIANIEGCTHRHGKDQMQKERRHCIVGYLRWRCLIAGEWLEEFPEETTSVITLHLCNNFLELSIGEWKLVFWIMVWWRICWSANLFTQPKITKTKQQQQQ